MKLPIDIEPYKLFMDMGSTAQQIFLSEAWRATKYTAAQSLLARMIPESIAYAARECIHDKRRLHKMIFNDLPADTKAEFVKELTERTPIGYFTDSELFSELERRGYKDLRK